MFRSTSLSLSPLEQLLRVPRCVPPLMSVSHVSAPRHTNFFLSLSTTMTVGKQAGGQVADDVSLRESVSLLLL
jgi:hypothetical protein